MLCTLNYAFKFFTSTCRIRDNTVLSNLCSSQKNKKKPSTRSNHTYTCIYMWLYSYQYSPRFIWKLLHFSITYSLSVEKYLLYWRKLAVSSQWTVINRYNYNGWFIETKKNVMKYDFQVTMNYLKKKTRSTFVEKMIIIYWGYIIRSHFMFYNCLRCL